MKKLLILTIAGTTISFVACTSKKATTSTKTATAASGELKKNYTDADLAAGKVIWQSHCNKCHRLYEGNEYTVSKWDGILPGMVKRAHLSDDDAAKVRAYLVTNAKAS